VKESRGFIFDRSKKRNLKALTSDKEGSLKGFTLVELLVVITIIGILTGISIVAYGQVQKNARDGKRKADLTSIQNALELYYGDHSGYPVGGGCMSSIGFCATCPCDPPGSDWAGSLVTALQPTYIKDLPIDPINNTSHYYQYDPVCNETSTICGREVTCTGGVCGPGAQGCAYELAVFLEDGSTFTTCSPP